MPLLSFTTFAPVVLSRTSFFRCVQSAGTKECPLSRRPTQRYVERSPPASWPEGNRSPQRDLSRLSRTSHTPKDDPSFQVLEQKQIFSRYQTVYQRDVKYPDGRVVSFDVLGNPHSDFKSVFVFPFDTKTKSVTLIREYSPGGNKEQLSLVAGMFDPQKHESLSDAARSELSEEARLAGGQLLPLSEQGVQQDKYSLNQFFYFLGLDSHVDESPKDRDAEEWISSILSVPLSEVGDLVRQGALNVPNSLCALLALRKLADMGYE